MAAIDRADLLKIYDIERRDDKTASTVFATLTTVLLAYTVGAASFMSSQDHVVPTLIKVGAPLPALVIASYITFKHAESRLRQSYIVYLETELWNNEPARAAPIQGFVTLYQGLFLGRWRLAAFAMLTVTMGVFHVLIAIGFTWYVTVTLSTDVEAGDWRFWAARILFGLIILANVYALVEIAIFGLTAGARILKLLKRNAKSVALRERARWGSDVETKNDANHSS